jgi:hypothetical protein
MSKSVSNLFKIEFCNFPLSEKEYGKSAFDRETVGKLINDSRALYSGSIWYYEGLGLGL